MSCHVCLTAVTFLPDLLLAGYSSYSQRNQLDFMTEKINVTKMHIMRTEFFFQWMSFIYLWWKPYTDHLKTKNPNKQTKGQSLTEDTTSEGTDEGQIYPSMTLSGWEKLHMLSRELAGQTPCSWQQAFGCSFFHLLSLLIRERTEQGRWDECSPQNHPQVFVT